MTEPLVTQQNIIDAFGQETFDGVFSDDGGRTVNETRLASALAASAAEGEAILRRGWPSRESIEALVGEDDGAKRAFCRLAIYCGVEAKPNWVGDDSPYATFRSDGRQTLKDLADGATKTPAEDVAGKNTNRLPRVNSRTFLFTPSRTDTKRPGGF